MNKITVGIIGAGRIGQLHANNIMVSNKFHLKAIADVDTDHLKGTNIEQKIPVITNRWEDLTEDPEVDAIFICTPTNTHVHLIKEIAKSGKHIFCEKPVSFNLDETVKALKVVREENVKFQIGFNRRFDKHFKKVYDIVRAGKVGTPHIIKITSRDPEAPPENPKRL